MFELDKISSVSFDRQRIWIARFSVHIHGSEGGQNEAAVAESGSGEEAVVTGQEHRDLSLIAHEVLDGLRADLASPELFWGYVGRYLEMWPRRYRRLVVALNAEDQEALMDAVLSIKTSAGMLGALRLEQLALDIEEAVRNGRLDRVRSFLDELELCGQLTTKQLRRDL